MQARQYLVDSGTITLRQITPLCSGAESPENAIEHLAIISAKAFHGLLWRNSILDHLPALVGKLVTACPDGLLFNE
ncbi:hypothetical protein [Kushneria indalinina]|uniref:hypothetical protein n=1 Tax=Kushneria indalinina TaxID=184067 RepID=UPI0014748125|nr:hypothetical protein [Kushneria indalinina]